MIEKTWSKIHVIKQIILSKKNILKNRVSLSLSTAASTAIVIFLMTGALYVRNEVIIYDEGQTLQGYTMEEDAELILKEMDVQLGELDYYLFDGFTDYLGEIQIMRAIDVTVSDDDTDITVKAKMEEDVKSVLGRAGILLGEYDTANYPLEYKCKGGEAVIINRGFGVKVTADGISQFHTASKDTVESLLKRAGITLSADDIVTPSLDTKVSGDTEIIVQRVEYKKRTIIEEIPYKTIEKSSNLLAIGQSEITTEGINGERKITALEKYIDGKAVSKKIISNDIIKKAKNKVVLKGASLATPYSKREFDEIVLKNGKPINYEYVISGKSCAYTAGSGSGTASGRKLQVGTVAVNPKVIPYGSLLYIVTQDGTAVYGAAVAADTGSFAGSSVVVDLYMGLTSENYATACNWGARNVDVYVINTGKY